MRLTRLIVLIMALITSVGFYMLYSYLTEDLESQTFQATEEALIDTAYILSSVIESDIVESEIKIDSLKAALNLAHNREFTAQVHNLKKSKVGTNIYITDKQGIVIYDSNENKRLGIDLSRHNDVFLALKDKYGARSTREDMNDSDSSILYIGVPIKKDNNILGALTVYKAQEDVMLFITSRRSWISLSVTMIAIGIIVFTISVFAWIFRPIGKLTNHAYAMSRGERPPLPKLGRGREVNTLGNALQEMREALDGRSYIEDYTQILTHELKSPLAAIRASSELLSEDMPVEQRDKFLKNIQNETIRSQRIIDGLLKLAQLEAKPHIVLEDNLSLLNISSQLRDEHSHRLAPNNIKLKIDIPENLTIKADATLFKAALANLLENAIHFSPENGVITLKCRKAENTLEINIQDQGPGIPDYAIDRVFERFYSISSPDSKQKSSGLGLAFVKEIIDLHHGEIILMNSSQGGTIAQIKLPL